MIAVSKWPLYDECPAMCWEFTSLYSAPDTELEICIVLKKKDAICGRYVRQWLTHPENLDVCFFVEIKSWFADLFTLETTICTRLF